MNKELIYVITGSSGVIGRSLIDLLAKNKIKKVFACIRKIDKNFENFISSFNDTSIHPIILNLENENSIKDCFHEIKKTTSHVDVLINNAGIAHGSLVNLTKIADLKRIFNINYFSQILLTQYFFKLLIKSKSANIINVGSTAGIYSNEGTMAYGSSKAAFMHTTKVMANEYAKFGIKVNCIAPFMIKSPMQEKMQEKQVEELLSASITGNILSPEDVSKVIFQISQNHLNCINGQILKLDNGFKY